MTRLLIVDFSAVFWRNWHASASEALTFARHRTVEQIRAHAAGFDHVAICLDSANCWRRDLWPGYKANRPEKDEAALEQMRQAQGDLAQLYPSLAHARWEADDVIADVVAFLPPAWTATILSADKDLLQLLSNRVGMYHIAQSSLITAESAAEKIGLPLAKFADYLALCGDKSDNVLGVHGVGHKRAVELLEKYDTIDGLYAAFHEDDEQFTPALRKALHDAKVRADCPISIARALVELPNAPQADKPNPIDTITKWKPTTKETMTIEADFDEPAAPPAADTIPQAPPAPPSAPQRALVAAPQDWARQLEPTDSRSAYGLAKVVVGSRMFSAYGTPEAAMLVIMAGREFGLGAMAALRSFHIVEGKPTMSAQAMMARCLEHPSCKMFRVVRAKCSNELATVEVQRHGWSEPETYTWGIEDAKRAGLASRPNWSKYPREMLINRCIAEAARFVWPEVMAGVYSPEEFGGAS